MGVITEEWLESTVRYLKAAIQSSNIDEKRHAMHLAKMLHDVLADQIGSLNANVLNTAPLGAGAMPADGEDFRAMIIKALMQRVTGMMMGAGGGAPMAGAFRNGFAGYGY
jgi:hypothetical protein